MPTATKTTKRRRKVAKEVVHIGLLIDESGSMSSNRASVITSVNEFIDNLREDAKEKDMRVTVAMFDERYDTQGNPDFFRVKIDDISFNEAGRLSDADYRPSGMTPLNDAMLDAIKRLDKNASKGDKVMLVTMTDGLENASEATAEAVQKAVRAKEKAGWAFIYLGANQDAWSEGGGRGVARHSSYNFAATQKGTSNAIGSVTNTARAYTTMDSASYQAASSAMSEATSGILAEDQVVDLAQFAPEQEKKEKK